MVRLTVQWEKHFFKRPWSDLLKSAQTRQNRWHCCWALKASWGNPEQHNCQQDGPAKRRHKVCHLWLESRVQCGWMSLREREKGSLSISTPAASGLRSDSLYLVMLGGCKTLWWHEADSWLTEGMFILSSLAQPWAARRNSDTISQKSNWQ